MLPLTFQFCEKCRSNKGVATHNETALEVGARSHYGGSVTELTVVVVRRREHGDHMAVSKPTSRSYSTG